MAEISSLTSCQLWLKKLLSSLSSLSRTWWTSRIHLAPGEFSNTGDFKVSLWNTKAATKTIRSALKTPTIVRLYYCLSYWKQFPFYCLCHKEASLWLTVAHHLQRHKETAYPIRLPVWPQLLLQTFHWAPGQINLKGFRKVPQKKNYIHKLICDVDESQPCVQDTSQRYFNITLLGGNRLRSSAVEFTRGRAPPGPAQQHHEVSGVVIQNHHWLPHTEQLPTFPFKSVNWLHSEGWYIIYPSFNQVMATLQWNMFALAANILPEEPVPIGSGCLYIGTETTT